MRAPPDFGSVQRSPDAAATSTGIFPEPAFRTVTFDQAVNWLLDQIDQQEAGE